MRAPIRTLMFASANDRERSLKAIGIGASAVCPYLVWELAARWQAEGALPDMDAAKIVSSYRQAVDKGLLKIMSKMGISMLTSYHGSQLFEAVGLGEKLIRNHFTETSSQVGGIGQMARFGVA